MLIKVHDVDGENDPIWISILDISYITESGIDRGAFIKSKTDEQRFNVSESPEEIAAMMREEWSR
jgi:hypothetical protein